MQTVIIKPIITEKSMQLAGKGKYTFLVPTTVKKEEIKKVVEKMFTVHVTDVVTITTKGRSVTVGKRRTKKDLQPTKKATVSLKTGEKIALFEQTQ